MRITRVDIEGYRSFSHKIEFHLDSRVSVILGANDHGKTNLLSALTHLNKEEGFVPDRDLNWDLLEQPNSFPWIRYHLSLSPAEQEQLIDILGEAYVLFASAVDPSLDEPRTVPDERPDPEVSETFRSVIKTIKTLTASRVGVGGALQVDLAGTLSAESMEFLEVVTDSSTVKTLLTAFIHEHAPRVELIQPTQQVSDQVTAEQLDTDEHDFMRGIFYYANIPARDAKPLFSQTDRTMRHLENASAELNRTLKAEWSQGQDLEFRLMHDSQSNSIVLRIKDPAVHEQVVRISRRSQGFTHFFRLKTMLYARQREHPADSYVFLFDEPGLYLHPSGQHDLLAVLEQIGRENQVVYATHSVFMINRSFPTRHRLVTKTARGSAVQGKPFTQRWGSVIDALGLSLPGTMLFAPYMLLVEGDSDPLYLFAMFQKLIARGQADIDLNSLAVLSTGNSAHTEALIRFLRDTSSRPPKMLVQLDGDDGGRERAKRLASVLTKYSVPMHTLAPGRTIEDYLPGIGSLLVKAAAMYVSEIANLPKEDAVRRLQEEYKKRVTEGVTDGISGWVDATAAKLGALHEPPSKVGIARQYAQLLESASEDELVDQELANAVQLAADIREKLGVPGIGKRTTEILETGS